MNNILSTNSNGQQSTGLHPAVYLDEQAVAKRWAEEDVRIYSILKTMEAVEDWVIVNDPKVEEAIKRLSNTIENNTDALKIGSACRDFLLVFAYGSSSRVMHILSCLDRLHSGSGLKMVQAAVDLVKRTDYDSAEGKLMVERLEILRKSKQLSRIFSQSRLRFVFRALREVEAQNEY